MTAALAILALIYLLLVWAVARGVNAACNRQPRPATHIVLIATPVE